MSEYVDRGVSGGKSGGDGEFGGFREFKTGRQKSRVVCDLTLLTNHKGVATKTIEIDEAGGLRKQSAANIYEGEAERITVKGLKALGELIKSLPPNRALCFGVAEKPKARLLTQEVLRSGSYPNAIARDRDHFQFEKGKPGILMLDCDAKPAGLPLNWKEIDGAITKIIPAWKNTQRLWRASSSAFLYRESDGSELIGPGGWRCYVMVDDAAAIPEVGAFLYQALWSKGHGYILISLSGQALDRSLIDASVWQPERVDFAAEPVLGEGLVRRAPKPVLIGSASLLSTHGIKAEFSLGEWRATSELLNKEKEKLAPQIMAARTSFVAEPANPTLAQKFNVSEKRLRSL